MVLLIKLQFALGMQIAGLKVLYLILLFHTSSEVKACIFVWPPSVFWICSGVKKQTDIIIIKHFTDWACRLVFICITVTLKSNSESCGKYYKLICEELRFKKCVNCRSNSFPISSSFNFLFPFHCCKLKNIRYKAFKVYMTRWTPNFTKLR